MVVEQLLPPPPGARSVDPTMSVNSTVASSPWGPGNLELQGVDHDVVDASREVDVVAVGCLVEVGGLLGGLASYRL
jgi:hypothetical protein